MMMRRTFRFVPFLLALVVALIGVLGTLSTTEAQGMRMRQVGGYGLVLRDTPTYQFGSLDSQVNGTAKKGEIVYINGWQIGVYHVADFRWVAASAVQPIIDASGNPMVNYVSRQGNQYYMNGSAIRLPGRKLTEAEKFLARPDVNAPITFNGNFVAEDLVTELVDTSKVWYAPSEPVVATMRVTDLYNFIYLRTAPSESAPRASFYAYAGEILTAYEVVDNRWYRIGKDVWAPA
jgi:hypothetical protein